MDLLIDKNGVAYEPYATIVCDTKEDFGRLQAAVEKQRNGGWKSCNKDGNPDTDCEYLVTARTERGYRYRRIAKYSAKSRKWDCLNTVMAWQELPETYEEE